MFYGFMDSYYLLLVVPALIIAGYAQMKVKSTFAKYSKVQTGGGLTGAGAARFILDKNGLNNVQIERVAGNLTDHFDPRSNVIRLSESVYNSASVASVGVAAHECGHAIQYATAYGPIKLRAAIVPLTQFGSSLSFPLILIGIISGNEMFMTAGIILFSFVTVFQLITLPVEFNASSRAIEALGGSGMVSRDEEDGVKKVLSAAALTYVAALIVSAMQLLRLVLMARNRRD